MDMNKEYNFDRVGKRMPYSMPADFFGRMQAEVLAQVDREEEEKAKAKRMRHRARLVRLYSSVAAVAASICLVVLVGKSFLYSEPSQSSQNIHVGMAKVDRAYDNLSQEEQEELNATYENDIYLSMQ